MELSKTIIYRVLNNKGTAQEAKEVAKWFATPEGQEWLTKAIIDDADMIDKEILSTLEDIPTEEMLEIILRNIRRQIRRRNILMAAAVIIPCTIIITCWININNRIGGALLADDATEVINAEIGKKEIIFQDGSSVILNSGSTIKYPHRFGLAERKVEIEGEAFFNIQSNNLRPFIVSVNEDALIKVTGTQFNVSAYNEDSTIEVTLIDGNIEFSNQTQTVAMVPNEQLLYNKSTGDISVSTLTDASQYTLWTEDVILFKDTPLVDVLQVLEQNYNVEFSIAEEKLRTYTYSFKTNSRSSLDSILEDLESISSIRFANKGDKIFVYSK